MKSVIHTRMVEHFVRTLVQNVNVRELKYEVRGHGTAGVDDH